MTETSYQRCNRLAEEAKARKRAALAQREPLPKSAFVDYDTQLVPVLVPVSGGAVRSTRQARTYDHLYMHLRPTEDKAFKAARGEDQMTAREIVRQEPIHVRRYCYGCKTQHDISDFDYERKHPSGLAFYCRKCRRRVVTKVYRRAA